MHFTAGEIIYGGSTAGSDESPQVVSERVQQMATAIYQEFERMIARHGEEAVKDVMPLVVQACFCSCKST